MASVEACLIYTGEDETVSKQASSSRGIFYNTKNKRVESSFDLERRETERGSILSVEKLKLIY
jgi:hypothetical protein